MLNLIHENEKIKDTEDKYETILKGYENFILRNCQNEFNKIQTKIENEYYFKSKKLKVLPVVLENGFILNITDDDKCVLYLTLQNIDSKLIGQCRQKESFNIIKYFYNMWPIFEINIKKRATVKLDLDTDLNFGDNLNDKQVMLKFEKGIENPETTIELIGVSE